MHGVMRSFAASLLVTLVVPTDAWGEDKERYEVGESVPVFTLRAVNGEDIGESYISVDRYFGPEAEQPKKAVLVSFFATYCEPCKREIPYLAALHDYFRDKGLQVMLISIDKEAEKIEVAKQLTKEANVSFPVLSDRFNIVAKRYFISKLPCVYLVNSEGKVAMVNVGYDDDMSKAVLKDVRKTLGEPVDDPVPEALAKFMNGHGTPAAAQQAVASAEGEKKGEGVAAADAPGGEGARGSAEQAQTESKKEGKKRAKRRKKGRRKKR